MIDAVKTNILTPDHTLLVLFPQREGVANLGCVQCNLIIEISFGETGLEDVDKVQEILQSKMKDHDEPAHIIKHKLTKMINRISLQRKTK